MSGEVRVENMNSCWSSGRHRRRAGSEYRNCCPWKSVNRGFEERVYLWTCLGVGTSALDLVRSEGLGEARARARFGRIRGILARHDG